MTKEQSGQKRVVIPFWLEISLILLCGVAASWILYHLIHDRNKQEGTVPQYTVTFAYQDGSVIEEKQVSEGKGVFPPELETEDVFRGWSSPFNNVFSDVETHPMTYHITDENLFYFDSVYALEGEEFTIDLKLSGTVELSSAKIIVEYDPTVMEYKGDKSVEFCKVTKATDGKLELLLNSDSVIRETLSLTELTFLAKTEDVYSTQISLRCEYGKLINAGTESSATVSTLNNKIYYLQEVDE